MGVMEADCRSEIGKRAGSGVEVDCKWIGRGLDVNSARIGNNGEADCKGIRARVEADT